MQLTHPLLSYRYHTFCQPSITCTFIFFQEFPNENDTYYLAHCYPYTFTDLKDDLEFLLNDSERQKHIQREVLCETRAGNSCFLVTVTNFGEKISNMNDIA